MTDVEALIREYRHRTDGWYDRAKSEERAGNASVGMISRDFAEQFDELVSALEALNKRNLALEQTLAARIEQ